MESFRHVPGERIHASIAFAAPDARKRVALLCDRVWAPFELEVIRTGHENDGEPIPAEIRYYDRRFDDHLYHHWAATFGVDERSLRQIGFATNQSVAYDAAKADPLYRAMCHDVADLCSDAEQPILPVYPQESELRRDLGAGNVLFIQATLRNLPIVDDRRVSWKQIVALRADAEAVRSCRALLSWLHAAMTADSLEAVTEIIAARVRAYRSVLMQYTLPTASGFLGAVVEADRLMDPQSPRGLLQFLADGAYVALAGGIPVGDDTSAWVSTHRLGSAPRGSTEQGISALVYDIHHRPHAPFPERPSFGISAASDDPSDRETLRVGATLLAAKMREDPGGVALYCVRCREFTQFVIADDTATVKGIFEGLRRRPTTCPRCRTTIGGASCTARVRDGEAQLSDYHYWYIFPERLYHYTSIATLLLILRRRCLRLTRLDLVNDQEEGLSGEHDRSARYVFVSCWTWSDRESILHWGRYTSDSGCRIGIRLDKLSVAHATISDDTAGDLTNVVVLESDVKVRRDFLLHGSHSTAGARIAGVLRTRHLMGPTYVDYVDVESFLRPPVNESESWFDLRRVGVVKRRHWQDEREVRFRLYATERDSGTRVGGDMDALGTMDHYEVQDEFVDVPLRHEALATAVVTFAPLADPAEKAALIEYCRGEFPEITFSESEIRMRARSAR